jgi:iron complex outermembrane receptor protein
MILTRLLASTALIAATAPALHAEENAPKDQTTTIVVTATPFSHMQDETPSIPAKVDAEEIRNAAAPALPMR